MENPFIYDLATTRNPRSAFSYTNYLFVRERLVEFTNSDRLNPLRLEFEDYLNWAAGHFESSVRYGSEVVGVAPEKSEGPVRRWNVAIRDANGQTQVVHARSIVGPYPSGKHDHKPLSLTSVDFLAGQRIISVGDYKSRRNDLRGHTDSRLSIALVGSGEQTMEVLDDLLTCPRLGNITVVTENESLAPLRILEGEQEPPQPRLCSIWTKPSCEQKSTVPGSSERVQDIYARAYEKQVASKGECTLRVVMGSRDAAGACSNANVIIAEQPERRAFANNALFHGLDALVLGCRQKGDSLEEVQFKRGAVAESCKVWMVSAHSEGGRSLAKDIAARAGEVVSALATTEEGRREGLMVAARM
jgi:L-ornithine N5-oxygenase